METFSRKKHKTMDTGQKPPSGLYHPYLRRVFIGLYPATSGLARIHQIVRDLPRSLMLDTPEDLHVTLLFGGDQTLDREPLWKKATGRAAQTLENFCHLPMESILLEKRHSILAIRFFGAVPFWEQVASLANTLSRDLLGLSPTKPFWPHMTLSRKASRIPLENVRISPPIYPFENAPFFAGVRLFASGDPEDRRKRRYSILTDFPFQQEQHGH